MPINGIPVIRSVFAHIHQNLSSCNTPSSIDNSGLVELIFFPVSELMWLALWIIPKLRVSPPTLEFSFLAFLLLGACELVASN